jgi:hypothetical protein
MTTNTGGPAFAQQLESNRDGYAVTGGMTLRDYFAAKAMQGDLVGGVHRDDFRITAKRAFIMADEMLKAREA